MSTSTRKSTPAKISPKGTKSTVKADVAEVTAKVVAVLPITETLEALDHKRIDSYRIADLAALVKRDILGAESRTYWHTLIAGRMLDENVERATILTNTGLSSSNLSHVKGLGLAVDAGFHARTAPEAAKWVVVSKAKRNGITQVTDALKAGKSKADVWQAVLDFSDRGNKLAAPVIVVPAVTDGTEPVEESAESGPAVVPTPVRSTLDEVEAYLTSVATGAIKVSKKDGRDANLYALMGAALAHMAKVDPTVVSRAEKTGADPVVSSK